MRMSRFFLPAATQACAASIAIAALTGCAIETTATPTPSAGSVIQGTVRGGQQPVTGSRIYVMAASNAGYESKSHSLLTIGSGSDAIGTYVTTGSGGSFEVSGDYICTPDTQIYALALGGNPGMSAGTNNTAIALMTNFGSCPATGTFALTTPHVVINEVTTAAAVYALAGYMTSATSVANSGSLLANTGMANAFSTTNNLVDITTGIALATTPAGNGTVPQATLNTLANIIASCVNSDGTLTGPTNPSPCYTLFHNAVDGATMPSDTISSMLNIAHHPAANVTALFNLASGEAPFQTALATAPSDFIVQLVFTGGGLDAQGSNTRVHNIAIDGNGNVWTTNLFASTFSEFNPLGAPLSGDGFTDSTLLFPLNIVVDQSNSVYVMGPSMDVVAFNQDGTRRPTSDPAIASNCDAWDLAFDPGKNVWVTCFFGSSGISKSFNGVLAPNTPFLSGTLADDATLSIQPTGVVWVPSTNGENVLANDGSVLTGSPFALTGSAHPFANAIDAQEAVWTTDLQNGLIFKQFSTGATAGGPFMPPNYGKAGAGAIAIDGSGNAWVVTGVPSIVELDTNGTVLSGPLGYAQLTNSTIDSLGIDGSGNVWFRTLLNDSSASTPESIQELIGAASPVVTPLAAAVAAGTLGTRP